jgi:flagellar biosynthesis protein
MTESTDPPTPVAVALLYDETSAPRVVATGKGSIAQEILRVAKEHEIPIKEQPELVELLAKVKLGEEIPPALYIAVAQIIAFAYRLKGKVQSTKPAR